MAGDNASVRSAPSEKAVSEAIGRTSKTSASDRNHGVRFKTPSENDLPVVSKQGVYRQVQQKPRQVLGLHNFPTVPTLSQPKAEDMEDTGCGVALSDSPNAGTGTTKPPPSKMALSYPPRSQKSQHNALQRSTSDCTTPPPACMFSSGTSSYLPPQQPLLVQGTPFYHTNRPLLNPPTANASSSRLAMEGVALQSTATPPPFKDTAMTLDCTPWAAGPGAQPFRYPTPAFKASAGPQQPASSNLADVFVALDLQSGGDKAGSEGSGCDQALRSTARPREVVGFPGFDSC